MEGASKLHGLFGAEPEGLGIDVGGGVVDADGAWATVALEDDAGWGQAEPAEKEAHKAVREDGPIAPHTSHVSHFGAQEFVVLRVCT
jgi:hypothetical protein